MAHPFRLPLALHAHHCPDCGDLMVADGISHTSKGSVVIFYCAHCETEQYVTIPAATPVPA